MFPSCAGQMTPGEPMIVRAEDLSVDLDGAPVLSGVSLSIERGRWIGLLGPNGAGKTTLLRSMGGLVDYRGALKISDVEVCDWDRRRLARKLAFVRQSVSLAFDFRVWDLVLLGRSPHKKWLDGYDHVDRELAADALERVDLSEYSRRSIHSLSAGEQQRVFLAQALVQEPEILLLDEPTAHLDIQHRFVFLGHVRDYVETGHTVIAAFHDLELACQYVDELIVLDRGHVAAAGIPSEVLTPDLIASVFSVDATVTGGPAGITGIRYHGTLRPPAKEGQDDMRQHTQSSVPRS